MKKLLIISDGKAGHENQSKAFCQALGYAYDCVHVRYPLRLHKLLSYVADRLSIFTHRLFNMDAVPGDHFYAAVVCTGSTAFYPGKVMARRLGAPVAGILYPGGYRLSTFDCVMAPAFDKPPPGPNIIPVPINLTAADPAFYEGAVEAFRQHHAQKGGGAVGVIVGGPTPSAPMTPASLGAHLDAVFKLTAGGGGRGGAPRPPPPPPGAAPPPAVPSPHPAR
ncbi:MAG: mitochondrial fission ELM1 family protein, partial [Kiritimatiellaeota bacterium]|nr:mitochondrial fission ELM1 family protein [Kiritimatiellota bacterium]